MKQRGPSLLLARWCFVAGFVVCWPIAMMFGIDFERGRVDRRGGRRGGWW